LLFRLAPTDYHRFHFPVSGKLSGITKIQGNYYSVNPIALRKRIKIFCENKREYQIIKSPVFGNVIMVEIGATMVGSIVHTFHGKMAVKGDESGYFQFGGSSIILLFQPGKIKIDSDLLNDTQKHLETSVRVGQHVAMMDHKSPQRKGQKQTKDH
jgi:phosphatidylserine decarboxylase